MWKNVIGAGRSSTAHNISWFGGDQLPQSVILILSSKDLNTDLDAEGQFLSEESDNDDNELI